MFTNIYVGKHAPLTSFYSVSAVRWREGAVPLDTTSVILLASGFFVAFVVTCLMIPVFASFFRRRGIVGVDVHKRSKPRIPEMCGVSIVVGIWAAGLALSWWFDGDIQEVLAFVGTVLIAGIVGVIDDLKPLNPKLKPVLTALAAIPILLLGTYSPHLVFPLIGAARLTILYMLIIPFAIAVPANAANMLDVFNGAMSGTFIVISATLALVFVLVGNSTAASLSLMLTGALVAFYLFNRYPARVFCGDSGSLAVGAAVGALAVIGRAEVIAIVVLVPCIMNAFYGLASIGRLYERREIKARPVRVREDGLLEATEEKNAPVTLTRLILAEGPLSEKQIVNTMTLLTTVASVFAVLTFLILRGV